MLKRAVIKEELVALTGDYINTILLQQLLYWSERVNDFDKFIGQEKERALAFNPEEIPTVENTNGWIYKKAEELSEETMIKLSPSGIRRHLKHLIENKWVLERRNPRYKWDKTLQYRINLIKIQVDLFKIGYFLEGYKYDMSKMPISILEIHNSNSENQNQQSRTAIPETTPEITPETTLLGISSDDENSSPIRKERISFAEYKLRHSVDKEDEDAEKSIEYYLHKYRLRMGEEHPNCTAEQWSDAIYQWFSLFDDNLNKALDNDITTMEKIIDAHFRTKYTKGEYNILHFLSGRIRINRFYEVQFDEQVRAAY